MANKKPYNKPEVNKDILDNTISIMFFSNNPIDPGMMMTSGDGSKGTDSPFTSPFDNKPFS